MNFSTDTSKIFDSLIATFLLMGRIPFSIFETYCLGRSPRSPPQYILRHLQVLAVDSQVFTRSQPPLRTFIPSSFEDIYKFVFLILDEPDIIAILFLEYIDESARDTPLDVNSNMGRLHDCQRSTPRFVWCLSDGTSMPPIYTKGEKVSILAESAVVRPIRLERSPVSQVLNQVCQAILYRLPASVPFALTLAWR